MIYSDRQYQITRAELAKLEGALAAVPAAKGARDWVLKAQADALQSQIADLQAEMAEYDMLKLGKVAFAETCSLAELPRVLVQARIARGLSQTDLAERLNMKPQQVQRYEATNYMSASLGPPDRGRGCARREDFGILRGRARRDFGRDLRMERSRRRVVEPLAHQGDGEAQMVRTEPPAVAGRGGAELFCARGGTAIRDGAAPKKVRAGNVPNEFALLAWQARVLYLAHQLHEQDAIKPFELNDTWLSELTRLTRRKDGPRQARDLLAEHGIALVIERHLPGTYLDGAAMLSAFSQPVVALTLRYDRLDNFWFVLFHELAHVFLHLTQGMRFDFFDEEEGDKTDRIEQEADAFALNTLIPELAWEQCLSRFVLTEEAVVTDAGIGDRCQHHRWAHSKGTE